MKHFSCQKTNAIEITRQALPCLQKHHGALIALLFFYLTIASHLYVVAFVFMAMLGLYHIIIHGRTILHDQAVRYLLVFFACLWLPMLFSLTDAVNFSRSASKVAGYLMYLPAAIFLVLQLKKPSSRSLLHTGILLFIVVAAASSVIEWLFFYTPGKLGYPGFFVKARGGHVLTILLPVILTLTLVQFRRSWRNHLWLVLLALTCLGIFLNGKRMALLLGVMALGMMALFFLAKDRKRLIGLGVSGISVVTLIALVTLKAPDFSRRILQPTAAVIQNKTTKDGSISERRAIFALATDTFKEHWINGVGARGFRNAVAISHQNYPVSGVPMHPHLTALEILVETGLIGGISFILFWFGLILMLFKAITSSNKICLVWLMVVALIAFPLASHVSFYASLWSGFLWIALSAALATFVQGEASTS